MSIFTYIFFPREVHDPRYLSNCYIHNISYEKADNMDLYLGLPNGMKV